MDVVRDSKDLCDACANGLNAFDAEAVIVSGTCENQLGFSRKMRVQNVLHGLKLGFRAAVGKVADHTEGIQHRVKSSVSCAQSDCGVDCLCKSGSLHGWGIFEMNVAERSKAQNGLKRHKITPNFTIQILPA